MSAVSKCVSKRLTWCPARLHELLLLHVASARSQAKLALPPRVSHLWVESLPTGPSFSLSSSHCIFICFHHWHFAAAAFFLITECMDKAVQCSYSAGTVAISALLKSPQGCSTCPQFQKTSQRGASPFSLQKHSFPWNHSSQW